MRRKRKYSLFRKENGRWIRLSNVALFKEAAVRFFQNALLAGAGELRPVDE